MKKFIKNALLLTLALITVSAFSITASAEGKVTYDGDAQKFIFAKGSEYSPTDLFENLKDVMPGDKLTETVTVDNTISEDKYIKVYMRSLGAKENTDAFLKNMNLTVTQREKSELFNASADAKGGLSDWVLLGTLKAGGKIDLDLTLEVSPEMGNEFQNAVGYIDWQFKVEEFDVPQPDPEPEPEPEPDPEPEPEPEEKEEVVEEEPAKKKAPKTGENGDVFIYLATFAGSAVVIGGCLYVAKKRKSK